MARGAAGPPSEFSRRVVENIERFRMAAGLSNTELLEAAGMSRSYYHSRLRLELPFNTNDLDYIAGALGVSPSELTLSDSEQGTQNGSARVDSQVLFERLRRVTRHDGPSPSLHSHLSGLGFEIDDADWEALEAQGELRERLKHVLTAVANQFTVPPYFLLAPSIDDVSDRIDAELELRFAMEDKGVKAIQARALGDISPKGLRALARALAEADDAEEESSVSARNRRRSSL